MRPALPVLLCTLSACPRQAPSPSAAPAPPAAAPAPAPSPTSAAEEEADLRFLEDVAETRQFSLGLPTRASLLPDGSLVLFLQAGPRTPQLSLYAFDVATGRTRELLTPAQVLNGAEEKLGKEERARRERMRVTLSGFTSYSASRDGKTVFVNLSGRLYSVPVAGGAAVEVAGPDDKGNPLFDAHPSPDARQVAFVRDDELWVVPVTGGKATQLTHGGTADLLHAQAEFVAQEEMDRYTGHWWSPDSRSLVYEVAEQKDVEQVWVADPADPTQPVEPSRYPRPGHANVKVTAGVIPAAGGKTVWLDWDHARYEYLANVVWTEGGPLTLVVQSRDQKDLALLAADPKTGKTHELLHEHDDAWVNLEIEYRWLRDGSAFLWSSDRGGAEQLELHAPDGTLVRALTEPGLGFRAVAGLDEKAGRVYVIAGAEPVESGVWQVPLAGGAAAPLTDPRVFATASFARDDAAYLLKTNSLAASPVFEVHRADGSVAGTLPSAADKPPFYPRAEMAKVGDRGLWTMLIRPRDFDPARKYPVIVDVYGGPLANTVVPESGYYIIDQWIADHGFIVALIDNRGTPGRGHDWERAIRGKFADVPLEDQVDGLRALGKREPAMDLSRVGIYGASFGGYMAALAVLRRPDVYAAAVAASPVSDWMDYDTHYTERYLGVPGPGDTVYAANGLIQYAADLKRPLLLIHGTADDNVHFSHTLELADALFRAGRPFELLPIVGQTHQLASPALNLRFFQRLFAFFREHLR